MKKFISLLSFEMNRFLKFLLPTLVIVAVLQVFSALTKIFSYNSELERMVARGESLDFVSEFTVHNITGSTLFELSILLIVLMFAFYSFFTWYREWLGKNTFIYRLLMLPTNRTYVILTKSLVFLIGGLLAFAFQFGMYFVHLNLAEWLVTSTHYQSLGIHDVQPMYGIIQHVLFPKTVFQFLSYYSFAFAALISLFTGIIIERSFGMKGFIFGVIYFVGYFTLFGLIRSIGYSFKSPITLLPSQLAIIVVVYQFIAIGLGYLISGQLLKKKIKV